MCLHSAFVAAIPTTPNYRILAAVLIVLQDFYTEKVSQWQLLDTKLHQAKSHAEMYEHYRHLEIYIKQQLALIKPAKITFKSN